MNKLAIVTGSSKGIGRAICTAFLAKGWHVIGLSRSSAQRKGEAGFEEILGDLMTEEPLEHLVARVAARGQDTPFGSIAMVHNFGLLNNASVMEARLEDWSRQLHANLTVPFLFTQALTPLMPPGSCHLYIGSTLSTMGVADLAAYTTSKHGLLGLMRSVACDLAPRSIRSNLIAPGFTATDMAEDVLAFGAAKAGQALDDYKRAIDNMTPLGRIVNPQEIGELAAFIAEQPAINGEIYAMNGGFGLK